MRFAVLPEPKASGELTTAELASEILQKIEVSSPLSFKELESAFPNYSAMLLRKVAWYLNSQGKIRFTPTMALAKR